jgi:hypothetical protein
MSPSLQSGERMSRVETQDAYVSGVGSAGVDHRQQTVSQESSVSSGAIHIEFPGRVVITVEHGADRAALQAILTTLASNDRLQGNPALEILRK